MMARMPEWSSRLTSPTVKPSRLSISSCDRTRSPEFLLPNSRPPSSTMAAHCIDLLFFLDLEHDLDPEILHALAGRADQVDHHVGDFDKGRRLRRRRFGMHLLAVAAHEEEPAGAAAENRDKADQRNQQLQLAL